MVKEVDIPFNIGYYNIRKRLILEKLPFSKYIEEVGEIWEKYKPEFENIDSNIEHRIANFYNALINYCPKKVQNCQNIDKATKEFEEFLKKDTGEDYKINLILE